MPKGTRIECTAHFDNSPNNPANPDPSKEVKWGDQSWEEMMIGWFDVAIPAKADPMNLYAPSGPATSEGFSKNYACFRCDAIRVSGRRGFRGPDVP